MNIKNLISFINKNTGVTKANLIKMTQDEFQLTKKRSVFIHEDFCIRFSYSKKNSTSFSNTVLSIKTLKEYDCKPFIVCLVTPEENYLFLANSTFLNKVSHSSKNLMIDNLVGSFNGSNILRNINGIENSPENFEALYKIHEKIGFEGNIERLVNNTHEITGKTEKLSLDKNKQKNILNSVNKSIEFMNSVYYKNLIKELDEKVKINHDKIIELSKIDNVNLRGRAIEDLISNQNSTSIDLTTSNDLSDYDKSYPGFNVAIDIKSKMLDKQSSPKGYNVDKLLNFLSDETSVYFTYIIAIQDDEIFTKLVPMFNDDIMSTTKIVNHWSGVNSRGTAQYNGDTIAELSKKDIDVSSISLENSLTFLKSLIDL